MSIRKKSKALRQLEKIIGPFNFGVMLESIRLCEEISQTDFAKKLGISPAHLCDIEKGRKIVSVERAYKFACILKDSKKQFVRIALQDQIDQCGIKMQVEVHAA